MNTIQQHPPLTPEQRKDLAQKARAAQQAIIHSSDPTHVGALALYFKAVKPAVVLALLAEIAQLKPLAVSPFDHDLARKLAAEVPPKTRASWEHWFKYDDHNYPSDRRRVKVADGQGNEAFAGYDDDRGWVTDRPIGPVVEWRELASK